MFLSQEDFATVVRSTPLISIDLVVENERGEFLLGQRTNRPAQGYWFVPGGRATACWVPSCRHWRMGVR